MYNSVTSYIKITEKLSYYNAREKDKGKNKDLRNIIYVYNNIHTHICVSGNQLPRQ